MKRGLLLQPARLQARRALQPPWFVWIRVAVASASYRAA
jgi:hypothetical protein